MIRVTTILSIAAAAAVAVSSVEAAISTELMTTSYINGTEYQFARYEIGDQVSNNVTGQFQYYDWERWCTTCSPSEAQLSGLNPTTFSGSVVMYFQTVGCDYCGADRMAAFVAQHGAVAFVTVRDEGDPGQYTRKYSEVRQVVPDNIMVGAVTIPFKEWSQFEPYMSYTKGVLGFTRKSELPDLSNPDAWDGKLDIAVELIGLGNNFTAFFDSYWFLWTLIVGLSSFGNLCFAGFKSYGYWMNGDGKTTKNAVMGLEVISNLLRLLYSIDPTYSRGIGSNVWNRVMVTISGPFSFLSVVLLAVEYRDASSIFANTRSASKRVVVLSVAMFLVVVEISLSLTSSLTPFSAEWPKKFMGGIIILEQLVIATYFMKYATSTIHKLRSLHSSSGGGGMAGSREKVMKQLRSMSRQVRYLAVTMYLFCIVGFLATNPITFNPLPHFLVWLGVFVTMNLASFIRINSLRSAPRKYGSGFWKSKSMKSMSATQLDKPISDASQLNPSEFSVTTPFKGRKASNSIIPEENTEQAQVQPDNSSKLF